MNKKNLFSGAVLLSAGTFASYILGAVRDAVFGNFFGVSGLTDAYLGAFLLADILMMIFISSALLGLTTPLFLREKEKNPHHAQKIFGGFFATLLAVFSGVLLIAGIFAPQIFPLLSPEIFATHPHEFIFMGRLFLFSNFIFALSNFLGTYLMAYKHFISTALAPLFYNIGILLGIIFFADEFGILAAAYGAVFGATMHMFSRVAEYFFQKKHSVEFSGFSPNITLNEPVLHELALSMLWKMGSVVIMPLIFLIFIRVSSTDPGLYTAFQYTRNLQSAPVAIFGIAFATAVFPLLSQFQAENNKEKFSKNFWRVFGNILFWTVPAAIGIFWIGDEILALLYGIDKTSQAFEWIQIISVFLSVALVFEAIFHLLSRTFYASKDISTPLFGGLIFVISAVSTLMIGKIFFSEYLVYFLASAYMVGYIFQMLFLLWKGKHIALFTSPPQNFWKKVQRIFFWAITMGVALFFLKNFLKPEISLLSQIISIGGISAISAMIYFLPDIWKKISGNISQIA